MRVLRYIAGIIFLIALIASITHYTTTALQAERIDMVDVGWLLPKSGLHLPFYVLLTFSSSAGLCIAALSALFSFSFDLLMSHGCIIFWLHRAMSVFGQYVLSGFIFFAPAGESWLTYCLFRGNGARHPCFLSMLKSPPTTCKRSTSMRT